MGFKKLFWGFIFLFDFRLGGLDIIPDFTGYIFFYQGLAILETKNEYFRKAKGFAFVMIFLSILDLYQSPSQLEGASFALLGILIGLVSAIMSLLMVYNICMGIVEEARIIEDIELESKANNRWMLYLVTAIVLLIGIILPVLMGILFVVIFIASILSYFLMLGLMNEASQKLEGAI